MATRKFCDYCDCQLTDKNHGLLIREKPMNKVEPDKLQATSPPLIFRASVMILNEHDHVVEDICFACQLEIVQEGVTVKPKTPIRLASLQQPVAADVRPAVELFAAPRPIKASPLSATPPPPPPENGAEGPSVFVPSTQPFPPSGGDASQPS